MTFDLQNENHNAGSSLRNEAANYLAAIYGPGKTEILVAGKKVDGLFTYDDLGSAEHLVLESKDYGRPLRREDVVKIWADYEPVLQSLGKAKLIIVSRHGLAPGAGAYVESRSIVRHRTIWELEAQVLGLQPYTTALTTLFDDDGLSSFYVEGKAREIIYNGDMVEAKGEPSRLSDTVEEWLKSEAHTPLAVLGGYGAGKSSFAKALISRQARRAINDPTERRPVLIKLGGMSRHSSLEGLLGSMFTSQYSVRGYNFGRFMEFNAKGRFLIALDGFDEMNHAMSFAEFRAQISEFNNLVVPGAKVILLGRPSAFTTDAEHYYVLKGRVRAGDRWRKLADWPEFRELRLVDFDQDERAVFVQGFLRHHASLMPQEVIGDIDNWVSSRSQEVLALAEADPKVFGRPVHLKILTELAADPEHDFTRLRDTLTRWSLYDEFFTSLARRESEKPARTPISEGSRLQFLRETAYWLWTEKSAVTNFVADSIPNAVLDVLPDGDTEEIEDKRREYLAGAFLERKPGDIYYFPHRSFAEFLVASRMLNVPPSGAEHSTYGALATEGVLEFLSAPENAVALTRWAEGLPSAHGALRPSYIKMLIQAFGGIDAAISSGKFRHWGLPAKLLSQNLDKGGTNLEQLRQNLLEAKPVEFALAVQLLDPNGPVGSQNLEYRKTIANIIAAVLLERVLELAREEPGFSRISIEGPDAGELKLLVAAAIANVGPGPSGRSAKFTWAPLIAVSRRLAASAGAGIDWDGPFESVHHEPQYLTLDKVVDRISPEKQQVMQKHLYYLREISTIIVVSRKPVDAQQAQGRGGSPGVNAKRPGRPPGRTRW